MKILLATDGSRFSQAAVDELILRSYPAGSEVKIISVVHPWPFIPEPTLVLVAAHEDSLIKGRKRAAEIVAEADKRILQSGSQLTVTTESSRVRPNRLLWKRRNVGAPTGSFWDHMAMDPSSGSFSAPYLRLSCSMRLAPLRSCA
jgi:hypothetical protein